MTATNNITGDRLVSTTSDAYRDNYDSIFGKAKIKDKPKNLNLDDTDLDKFKDLFSKSKITFVEEPHGDGTMIYIEVLHKDRIEVQGYSEFYSYYAFDSNGNFLYTQIGHDI